jgi:hypothetical protein
MTTGYELWDGEMGIRLGEYETERDALAAVRQMRAQGMGSVAPLGLVVDGAVLVAHGEALVQRAERSGAATHANGGPG